MSVDYPFYEKLVRRRHRAAWWWLIGDRLYYLGLVPAALAIPGLGSGVLAALFGFGWRRANVASVVFVMSVLICIVGSLLKRRAYRLSERDGITPH